MIKHLRSISKDVLIYMSGSVIVKIAGLILMPVYTYFLLPEDYGILGYVSAVTAFFSMVVTFGLDGTMLRFYFDYENNSEALRDFLGTIYLTAITFALIAVISVEIIGNLKPFIFSSHIRYAPYIRLGIMTAFFAIIPNLSLNYYRAQKKSLKFISFSIASFLLSTGFVIYLVAFKKKGALGSLEGSLIAGVIICLAYAYDLRKSINYKIVKEKLTKALKYGLPLVPSAIGGWIMLYSGRIFIEEYSSLHDLGIFNVGFNLSSALLLIIVGFNSAWYPFFFATIKETSGTEIIARTITIYILVLLSIVLFLNAFSYEVIHIMANQKFWDSYKVIPLLVIGFLFQGLYYMPSSVVLYKKKTHYQAIITLVIAATSLVINFILTPKYGMYGVSATIIYSYFVLFIANYFLSRRYIKIPYEYVRLLKLFALFGIVYFLISLINLLEVEYMLLYKLSLITVFPIILYLSGVFTNNEKEKVKLIIREQILSRRYQV